MAEAEVDLNDEEKQAVQVFIHQMSLENAFGDGIQVTEEEAIQFLMARKFDVGRAISLFHTNQFLRGQFKLKNLNPQIEPLSTELLSGKFTVLAGRGEDGATVCLFYAKKHFPKLVDHITVLKSLVYQLDHVMACRDSQRYGLSLIYDMSGAGYQNFDFDLARKVLHLLKGGYPARLKHVYILSAPLWFRASMTVLTTFLRDKIRDRVEMIRTAELVKYIAKESLPEDLGGSAKHDHYKWISQCINTNKTKSVDKMVVLTLDGIKNSVHTPTGNTTTEENYPGTSDRKHIFEDKPVQNDVTSKMAVEESTVVAKPPIGNNIPPAKPPRKPLPPPPKEPVEDKKQEVPEFDNENLNEENEVGDDKVEPQHTAMVIDQFVSYMAAVGRKGVNQEYEELRSIPPSGTFETTLHTANLGKNRYNNILAYEETRVHLQRINNDPFSDYINANFVHGYKKKNKFICTQGPTPQTYFDFWRMIWEQRVGVIVMITRCIERGRPKCGQYWPQNEDESMAFEHITISYIIADKQDDYTLTLFELRNEKLNTSRRVCHIQFTTWPDFGVLHSASPIFEVMDSIAQYQEVQMIQINNELKQQVAQPTDCQQEDMQGSGEYAALECSTPSYDSSVPMYDFTKNGLSNENQASTANGDLSVSNANHANEDLTPPIVVHCSAGVGRTGTFCCLSNCMERLNIDGKIDIFNTVLDIRSQRAFSVQTEEQYQFCYTGVLEGIIRARREKNENDSDLQDTLYNFFNSDLNSE